MKTIAQVMADSARRAREAKPRGEFRKEVMAWPWKFEAYAPELKPVLPAVLQWCSDLLNRQEPHWLTLLGPSGIGKTLALRQAYQFAVRHSHLWEIKTPTGQRWPACAHIKPAKDLDAYDAPKEFSNRDLAYVEDITVGSGMDKGSGAVLADRLAELLHLRTGKWTLIDGNMSRALIELKIDGRIASRLKRDGSVLIEIPDSVPDYNG
jgi:hypothetical protein